MKGYAPVAMLLYLLASCVVGTVEAPEACKENSFKRIESGPTWVRGTISIERPYDLSSSIGGLSKVGEVDVFLRNITVTSRELSDLSFIESLQIEAMLPGGGLELVASTDSIPPGTRSIPLTTEETSTGLAKALAEGPVTFRMTGTGKLPADDVTPMVRVCGRVKSTVNKGVLQ